MQPLTTDEYSSHGGVCTALLLASAEKATLLSKPLRTISALSALTLGGIFLALPTAAHSKNSGASITGTIRFSGKAPVRPVINTSTDAACKSKALGDEVIVTKGKLKDVHVRIKSGTAGKHPAPKQTIVVVQDGCVYSPHVVGAMVGQTVSIANKDQTMHNVHAYIGGETWFNRSQPKGAPNIVETDTGEAGGVFELLCNVHPWMHNFIPITDHPYFDVSKTDGSFAIKNVPAGKYTLEAWHPKYGLKTKKIKVGSGTTKVSFKFP